jgi:uncharacterized protein YggU (UPF0235/DUF167 family)
MARLAVKLTPGAASDRIDGWDLDPEGRPVLKVRVRARPVEGQANATLSLMRGGQSRLKMIEVEGMEDEDLRAHLTGM